MEISLTATQKYYEYTFTSDGKTYLPVGSCLSTYQLQGLTGVTELNVIDIRKTLKQKIFTVDDLIHKRYFLMGRHNYTQQQLHQTFLRLGLIKVGTFESLKDGDLVFYGSHTEAQILQIDSLDHQWLVDGEETTRFYESVIHIFAAQQDIFTTHFEWLMRGYQDYPRLFLSKTVSSDDYGLSLSAQSFIDEKIPDIRISVLNGHTPLKHSFKRIDHKPLDIRIEVRNSISHFTWANLIVILWKGQKQHEQSLFGLKHLQVMPFFCHMQSINDRKTTVLLTTQIRPQSNKFRRLQEQLDEWNAWRGTVLEVLEVTDQDFNRLQKYNELSPQLIQRFYQLTYPVMSYEKMIDHQLNDQTFTHLPLRLIPSQNRLLSDYPISSELLTWLGLVVRSSHVEYRVRTDDLWCFVRPISLQTLYDYFGSLSNHIIALLSHYGDLEITTRMECLPILLNTVQALLLCDVFNLLFGLEFTYFTKTSLVEFFRTTQSKLALKECADSADGFRLPSLYERESFNLATTDLNIAHSKPTRTRTHRPKNQWYTNIWGLDEWGNDSEWSHDDPYHWRLEIEAFTLNNPFWCSLLAQGQSLRLDDIKMTTWHPSPESHTGSTLKRGNNRASLRLIYERR